MIAASQPRPVEQPRPILPAAKTPAYLFSLGLNPPEGERVPVAAFEDALARIEKKLGLEAIARAG